MVFPWALLVGFLVLAWYGFAVAINPWLLWPWFVVTGTTIVWFHMVTRESWLFRVARRLRRGADDLMESSVAERRSYPLEDLAFDLQGSAVEPFQANRRQRLLALALILICLWGLAVTLWLLSRRDLAGGSREEILPFIIMITTFSLLPFGTWVLIAMKSFSRLATTQLWWWILAAFVVGATVVWLNSVHRLDAFLYFAIFLLVFGTSWVNQRLWASDTALNVALRQISLTLLKYPDPSAALQADIPALIRNRLQYDRVFIVEREIDGLTMKVVGQAAENGFPDMVGRTYLVAEDGLTTAAVREGQAVVWNDIRLHEEGYLNILVPEDQRADDTKSEIAVPIVYHDEVFGVLSIQSPKKGRHGYGDRIILQTVGQILGAAISAHRSRVSIQRANAMPQDIARLDPGEIDSSEPVNSRHLASFARFARERLGASSFVYYTLTPTGFPLVPPFHDGVDWTDTMETPFTNWGSPIFALIRDFELYATPNSKEDTRLQDASGKRSTFVDREGVEATCFLPIGTPQEPLGALFLNYKVTRDFDDPLFIHLIQSFAHHLTTLAWRARDRYLIFRGFARPELDIHRLAQANKLKGSILREVTNLLENRPLPAAKRGIKKIARNVDRFIDQARWQSAKIPPDFSGRTGTLKQHIENHIATLRVMQVQVSLRIDPFIEVENPTVILAVYRLITEAISNAEFHGEARHIEVVVERQKASIFVSILDDGKGIPRESKVNKGYSGIYFLRDEFKRFFGAEVTIAPRSDPRGTAVTAEIPALPLL
jgi:GAF domain-containing protein